MSQALFPESSFPPGRNEVCFCGSGQRFKRCCGMRSDDREPPFGVGMVNNFLSPDECSELLQMADAMPGNRFTTPDGEGNRVLDKQRMTEWVNFQDSHQKVLDDVVARAFKEQVIPAVGQNIEWYEEPQLLRYAPGDYYLHHSDAYQLIPEEQGWRKVVDRDISLLLYLNDDYEGGTLEFKRLFYSFKPRAGMLLWFPSDVRYEHMAMPVTSGRRYALVSWAALSGVERVQAGPAKRSINWETGKKKLPVK